MRASAGTEDIAGEWVSVNPLPISGPSQVLRDWTSRRWIFLGWFLASFLIWAGVLLVLASFGFIQPRAIPVGMLLWPLFMLACALPFAWILERRVEERHRRELAELQTHQQEANLKLLVLQAQIEPHFLFNTLASLRALLREDATQAEAMVDALVRHLRAVLPVMREENGLSTLSDQLAICSSYLQLMAIRLENRLTWRIEVADPLLKAGIPPLMLLTLVENAVKHGIEPAGAGLVSIQARHVHHPAGAFLEVRVVNTGVGLPPGPGSGLGLANLREQLALRYGEQADLSLHSHPDGNTIAAIVLPLTRELAP